MYQIKDTERQALVSEMTKLFNEYDYEYSLDAVDKIIDTWVNNKSSLIEAFHKHSNYVEGKFLIAFESDYDRDIDTKVVNDFAQWIKYECITRDRFDALPDEVQKRTQIGNYLPYDLYDLLWWDLPCITSRTIDDRLADKINRILPNIKAHIGEKTSRVVNRICTYLNYHKHPEYNRQYAKYADALTPLKIKRHTILSINPIDYLTMSFGNSWSSCHTIDKENRRRMPNTYEGQYSSGTISYMLDDTSMVFYTVDASYDGKDFYTQPKINRQMYHWGEDKLIQSRLYPQNNDGSREMYTQYRAVVQAIMSVLFDFPNLWVKKNDAPYHYVNSCGTHYRDYEHFNSCNVSIPKDTNNEEYITVGHDPICIQCGLEHEISENINCCQSGRYYCSDCGECIDEDDVCWINDDPYCSNCATWCDYCQEYEPAHRVHWIPNIGENICEYCLDHHFTTCEDCGEYVYNDDINNIEVNGRDRFVCNDCLEDRYEQCEECDAWHEVENIKDIVDSFGVNHRVCEDCFDKLSEEYEKIAIANAEIIGEDE